MYENYKTNVRDSLNGYLQQLWYVKYPLKYFWTANTKKNLRPFLKLDPQAVGKQSGVKELCGHGEKAEDFSMTGAASWTAFDTDEKYNVYMPLPTVLSTAFHTCTELRGKKNPA